MGEGKKAPRVAPYLRFLFSDTDVNAQVFKKTTQISSSYKYHCNEIFSVGIIFFYLVAGVFYSCIFPKYVFSKPAQCLLYICCLIVQCSPVWCCPMVGAFALAPKCLGFDSWLRELT